MIYLISVTQNVVNNAGKLHGKCTATNKRAEAIGCRLRLKCDGTRSRTGGEVKEKLANGMGSQYSSHYLGTWCIQHYYR